MTIDTGPEALAKMREAAKSCSTDHVLALIDALEEVRASRDADLSCCSEQLDKADAENDALRAQLELAMAALREARDAENAHAKEFWQAWAAKRLEISRTHWLRAAKLALNGDMRDLRLRVQLAEAPPVAITLSEDAALEGKAAP